MADFHGAEEQHMHKMDEKVEKIGALTVVSKDADGVQLSNGLHIDWTIAKSLGVEPVFQRQDEVAVVDNKALISGEIDQLKRGVGRADYANLAEAFRRNVELGLTILGDMRQMNKNTALEHTYSTLLRTEAEALVKENLLRLRSLTL